ncbi:MAG TPA: TAT-variant-translocated molybdopterin oxidoreductase, partial [Verrucomicrobiae bacterium]
MDWESIRQRLKERRGQDYWRSLDELAETPEFKVFCEREFPAGASEWTDPLSRRNFLKLMAGSIALAGFSGCTQRQPNEKIVPYIAQPEQMTLGRPLYFATAMPRHGFAEALLVKSREGRPVKIEGNPQHPMSRGATSIFGQASLLDLYDPDRSKAVINAGEASSWTAFLDALNIALQKQSRKAGAGLRLLTGTITSPTLTAQIQALLKKFPEARWHAYEPLHRDSGIEGAKLAFGENVETQYAFENAKVILSLDADFLSGHPAALRYSSDFILGRRLSDGPQSVMNRLYVVESQFTVTGSMADHRLPLPPSEIERVAFGISELLSGRTDNSGDWSAEHNRWIRAVAEDLQAHRGSSAVIAGDHQTSFAHMLVHRINQLLDNVGKTISYTEPIETSPTNHTASVRELTEAVRSKSVDMLVIMGTNPIFNAPVDLEFARAMTQVPLAVHLGQYEDETAAYCHWHIPETHYLESWGDIRAFDGTVSLIQPLIEPLYGGKSALELLEVMLQIESGRSSYEIVHDFWQKQSKWADFEKGWRRALHEGLVADSAAAKRSVRLRPDAETGLPPATSDRPTPSQRKDKTGLPLEIAFAADPTIGDGSFANNAWLQEHPKPITKLTWDNAAFISPVLAQRQKISNGDLLELRYRNRTLQVPAWIVPGHPDGSVMLTLGYGRKRAGRVALDTGFNTYKLRTSDAMGFGHGLELRKTGKHYALVSTQQHQSLHGRPVFREGTWAEYQNNPHFADEQSEVPKQSESFYNLTAEQKRDMAWGMVIDLNACIGCSSCNMACYAENNIPVVGKEQVQRGREMQWIRVDTYFRGPPENPEAGNQPVPCMHCETAPSELVCPDEATLHNSEGLNLQVYNRCIGTRYCSNN